MRVSELAIDLGGFKITCGTDEIEAVLATYLREMRSVARLLRADERVALRKIMSRESGTLTVGEVFHDFARESEAHKTLRRLRAAQFIRPARSGRWDADEPIEVKPFGRLMWEHVGEAALCAPSRGVHVVTPAPEQADGEQPVVGWDDADVLDDLVRQSDEATREPAHESHFS
jgi:hypothetical protein